MLNLFNLYAIFNRYNQRKFQQKGTIEMGNSKKVGDKMTRIYYIDLLKFCSLYS
jgi:hypothetical protein